MMKRLLSIAVLFALVTVCMAAEKGVLNTKSQKIENRSPSKDDFIHQLKPSVNRARTRGLALVPSNSSRQTELPTPGIIPTKVDQKAEVDVQSNASLQEPVTAPQISVNLTFGFNSAELTDETRAILDNLGQAMQDQQLKPYRFLIEGHTDSIGGAAYNWELSLRRAAAVKRYLIEKHEVVPERMEVVGKGESEPIYPENPKAPGNRRVVIINIGTQGAV